MRAKAKTLAGVLVGVVLCAAVGASAASGSVLNSEISGTTFFKSTKSTAEFQFAPKPDPSGKGRLYCSSFGVEGAGASATKTFTKLTLHPSFSGCGWFGLNLSYAKASVTVPAACNFELALPGGSSTAAQLSLIGCPPEAPIKIVGYGCTVEISNQTGLNAVNLTNSGTGTGRTVGTQFQIEGLKTKQSALGCYGGLGTFTNGKLNASVSLAGYSSEALTNQVGIWVE